jgi:hypothetical protein
MRAEVFDAHCVTPGVESRRYDRRSAAGNLQWIPGASDIDLYDKSQYVTPAVERLAAFFERTLQ